MNATREARRVLWIILLANWSVAAIKVAYGLLSGSVAISADGIHSFADGAGNVVALIALALGSMPPDEGHPYGHRKFELLGALAIGVMILLGIAGVARRTFSSAAGPPDVGPGGFVVVLGTLACNVAVAAWEARVGRRLASPLLQADARHTASDVLATTAVLVAFVTEKMGLQGGDRAAAVFIMALVGLASVGIFRSAVGSLVDAAPLDRETLIGETLAVPGVVDCHKVRSRGVPGEVLVDLHIQVEPTITVTEGHRIAHGVQRALRQRFPDVVEVVVHTEPASEEQLRALAERSSVGPSNGGAGSAPSA